MSGKYVISNSLPVLIILIFTIFVLWPGLDGPLVYDDHPNLAPLLKADADYKSTVFENKAGPFGRSVTMASFVLNHWLSGKLIPFELKITNLFIHLINGLLAYFFLYILIRIITTERKARTYALLIMGFWILNPINTETVLYTIQRAALLSTTFMLIACITYLRMRLCRKRNNIYSTTLFLLSISSWFIAMLCKENAVILPLVILIIEVCFFDRFKFDYILNKGLVGVSLLVGIAILFLSIMLLSNSSFMDYTNKGFSLEERLYTQPVAIMVYLFETLFPQNLELGLYRDDFTIRKTFWNPATICSSLFLIALLSVSLSSLMRHKKKYIGVGILIFFSGYALESSIFPLELFFRHRNYFPSIGIYLSIILIVDNFILENYIKKLLVGFSILYLMLLAQHSYSQSQIWSSYDSILVNAYENHPESISANLEIVGRLVKQGDLISSLSTNSAIISARPMDSFPAKIQRVYIYCELTNKIPTKEYELLEKDLNLVRPLLISSALNHLFQSYVNKKCDFINIRRIVDALTSWTNTQLLSGKQSALDLWTIDYYMIEFLLLLDAQEEAMKLLNLHVSHNNSKAIYFKNQVFKSDKY